jgi:Nuclear pore complex assembly
MAHVYGRPTYQRVSYILERRLKAPQQLLLIDRLLQLAGLDPLSLFPPRDVLGLRTLLSSVNTSETFDTLKKDCLRCVRGPIFLFLIFCFLIKGRGDRLYLLKFYEDGRDIVYSDDCVLPKQFVQSTNAYWNLDNGRFTQAVKSLAHASLDGSADVSFTSPMKLRYAVAKLNGRCRQFVAAILESFPPKHRLSFFRLAKPTVTDLPSILLIVDALTMLDFVSEAWIWGRKLPAGEAEIWLRILETAFGVSKGSVYPFMHGSGWALS